VNRERNGLKATQEQTMLTVVATTSLTDADDGLPMERAKAIDADPGSGQHKPLSTWERTAHVRNTSDYGATR
jgi:hypothetical protein